MKKLLLTAILLVSVAGTSQAVIRTVSNMSYSPGQFMTFASALTASSPGDTIYVHGSAINYGVISVNKNNIIIIGAGHNPAKTVPMATMFTSISLTGSGCQFIGLSFNVLIAGFPSNGTIVKRCKLQATQTTSGIVASGAGSMDSWLIEGNVFFGGFAGIDFGGLTSTNTIVRNNVFNSHLQSNSVGTTTFSFLVSNNIFIGTNFAFSTINNALIDNNIFYRSSPQGAVVNCVMNNNISYQCVNNNFSAPGSNNLVNVNPMFTSFPGPGALFDYSHDYHLAAGSPGILTGDDGTDRGVYGGFGGKFNMTGEPAIAEVTDVTITSPTIIAPGGSLTISVTSKRVN